VRGRGSQDLGQVEPRKLAQCIDWKIKQCPVLHHPGGNPGANLKSISHRCHPILVAFVWELTKETIDLPLACLLGGWSVATNSP